MDTVPGYNASDEEYPNCHTDGHYGDKIGECLQLDVEFSTRGRDMMMEMGYPSQDGEFSCPDDQANSVTLDTIGAFEGDIPGVENGDGLGDMVNRCLELVALS